MVVVVVGVVLGVVLVLVVVLVVAGALVPFVVVVGLVVVFADGGNGALGTPPGLPGVPVGRGSRALFAALGAARLGG